MAVQSLAVQSTTSSLEPEHVPTMAVPYGLGFSEWGTAGQPGLWPARESGATLIISAVAS